MDELRKKYKRGQIDKKTYQEKLTELTIFHLEAICYKYVGLIADGSHGVVVEMKSPKTVLNVAVKIAFDDFEPLSGIISWSKLIHENVLPLITWRVIKEATAKVFITVKHDKTLQNKITSFRSDFSGFEKAVSCTKDISNAINYLHHQDLCHLNLAPDRIFVDYNNKAKLGGFGYLTSKDTKIVKFGATAAFRPPEAFPGTSRKIDGQKFDVWSLGILALETFTGQYLSKEMSKWPSQPATWHMQLYGLLYEVLEKENFNELVKKNFPNWKADDEKLNQALNFIQSCLIFNPEDRPSAENLFELRLLGGYMSKIEPFGYPDVWAEMVGSMELVNIASKKKKEDTSDSESDISDDENDYVNGEQVNDSDVIEKELSTEREKMQKGFENLIQKSKNLNLVICEENGSFEDEDNKEISATELKVRDATVKNHEDSCGESYSTEIYTSVYEKATNMKKKENAETKTKENVKDNMNMSLGGNDVKEVDIDFKNIDLEKRLKDIKKNIERLDNEIKANNEMHMSTSDEDAEEKKNEIKQMNQDLYMTENTNVIKKETEDVEIMEDFLEDVNISNKDRDGKNEFHKNTEDVNTKGKTNCIQSKAENTKIKEVTLLNMNLSKNDEDVNEDPNTKEKINDVIVDKNVSNLKVTVHEQLNEAYFDCNEVEKASLQYEPIKSHIFNSDADSTKTLLSDFEASKKRRKIQRLTKKNKAKNFSTNSVVNTNEKQEKINYEAEMIKKKNDVKEVNIEFEKTNEDIGLEKKLKDIKKNIERLDNEIKANNEMHMSTSDEEAEEKKNEIKQMNQDLYMTENTNVIKKETEDVEIMEDFLEDVNISNKDRDVKSGKNEFYKNTEDVNTEEKTSCIKNNAENTETEKIALPNLRKNNEDVNEDQNTKEEINDAIVENDVSNLNDTVSQQINKTNFVYNEVEKKSLQCELIKSHIFNSDTDSTKTLSSDFEEGRKKRKIKRRTKKNKAKNFSTNSIVKNNENQEKMIFEAEMIKRKISEENETASLSEGVCVTYSINTCKKRDDTNQKKNSSRKMSSSKSWMENVEQSPTHSSSEDLSSVRKSYFSKHSLEKANQTSSTSSLEKQRLTRTNSHKKTVKKSELTPPTSTSTQIEEDGNEDLEPGEVPLFRKNYNKVVDSQDSKYSVASLSEVCSNYHEEDLEEGEIGSKNTGSNYDSKSVRIRRRFKHLHSWWKRQKKNLTTCFTTCFRTSDIN